MGYFDTEEGVNEYIEIAEGYDGRELVEALGEYLPEGATVLELGMGPGKDLDLLAANYTVTGSDSSRIFVERYGQAHPYADLIVLDAATMATERRFDGIYSNKVLHHLTREELKESFARQALVVKDGGVLLHSFWLGDKEEVMQGLRLVYWTESALEKALGDAYDILETARYTEMEDDDSFYVILKRR
jgi:cyclopropane fatty-acyl-phospholipid synthase-like methyltransferase